jgi:trimeric autotransporter adhesin
LLALAAEHSKNNKDQKMANTVIQLKFSEVTSTPASLNVAEPAYSNNSNKLFIGLAGNQVIAIGGKYYTDIVDAATDTNTVSTIVKRDASGNFSAGTITAALSGNATSATTLQTARLIGVSGDITTDTVSFNGSADANLTVTLSATDVSAGTYGGATQIPTFVVDAKGRLTSAANVAISSSFDIAGDTGTGTVAGGETLTFVGRDGITTVAVDANNSILVDVDNTVVRTTGGTISGDLAITGNLIISGNTVTQDVETMKVEDSLIQLAANNAADAVDIGFFGQYDDGTTKYTTLFRDASDSGKYKLLTGGTTIPSAANSVDPSTYSTATLVANITGGTVSGLTSAIGVADGGTGAGTFTAGGIIMGNDTGALSVLANSTYTLTGGLAAANTISSLTVDAYGRVTAATGIAIAIDTAAITSGTLAYARGGTGSTSYTTGELLVAGATGLTSLANSSYTLTGALSAAKTITSLTVDAYGRVTAATGADISIDTSQLGSGTIADARLPTKGTAGTYANASHVPVITTDAYGRVTAVTNTAIAIAASQVTSGSFSVSQGGTGVTSFTANSVLISGATSTSAVVSLNSSTEGHVLQISSTGVPTFAHLNGGSF